MIAFFCAKSNFRLWCEANPGFFDVTGPALFGRNNAPLVERSMIAQKQTSWQQESIFRAKIVMYILCFEGAESCVSVKISQKFVFKHFVFNLPNFRVVSRLTLEVKRKKKRALCRKSVLARCRMCRSTIKCPPLSKPWYWEILYARKAWNTD